MKVTDIVFLVILLIGAIFGYFLMTYLLWDVMDEVFDCGDHLVVKYRGQEDVINLRNIINVNVSNRQGTQCVNLQLRATGKFGKDIAFFQ